MPEILNFTLLCLTSFFTIINPFGVMPVFMTMTSPLDEHQRRKTARKATLTAFIVLVIFALSGQVLFKFFGISVASFRIAGGVLFFIIGFDMMQARLNKLRVDPAEVKEYVTDISVTPLGIPMITGPGAITNVIVLMEDATNIYMKFALFFSIIIILAATYFILLGSAKITDKLGITGNKVLMRLMGLIVMVTAVEFFFAGLTPIIREIFKIQ